MELRSSGTIRRLHLQSVWQLVPALSSEWQQLRFGSDGRVIHAITGQAVDRFALVSGAHRSPGARYRVLVARPVAPGVGERAAEGTPDVEPEHEDVPYDVLLRRDDGGRVDVTVSDERERWSIDIDLDVEQRRAEVRARIDVTAVLRADGSPGCIASWLGGAGGGEAIIDLGSLDAGGTVLSASGSVSRFRGVGTVEVETSSSRWDVDARARIRARGIGRLVLIFGGRRLREQAQEDLDRFWSGSERWVADTARQIEDLRRAIDEEGGPEPYVHRAVWDPDGLHGGG